MNRARPIHILCIALITLATSVSVWARCSPEAEAGEVCRLHVSELRPTQFSVGMVAVDCKRQKLERKSKKALKRYLRKRERHVPAVIGPDGEFYITDHHHLSTALYRARPPKDRGWGNKDKVLYIDVVDNLYTDQDISQAEFWNVMLESHWAWLYDNKGLSPMNPALLPADLGGMLNDPYRTLSRWVRESCGYLKTGKEQCASIGASGSSWFMEFYWANFLRSATPLPLREHPVCQNQPYTQICLPDEVTELRRIYAAAMQAAASDRAKGFFESRGLNPSKYGYNPTDRHLNIEISTQGCEEVTQHARTSEATASAR